MVEKITTHLKQREFSKLFTEGCCFEFSLALINNHPDFKIISFLKVCSSEIAHVAVQLDEHFCIDANGKQRISTLSKNYSGWDDIKPVGITKECITDIVSQKRLPIELKFKIKQTADAYAQEILNKIR